MNYLHGLKETSSYGIVYFEKKQNFMKALEDKIKYAESMIKQGFESHEFSIIIREDTQE